MDGQRKSIRSTPVIRGFILIVSKDSKATTGRVTAKIFLLSWGILRFFVKKVEQLSVCMISAVHSKYREWTLSEIFVTRTVRYWPSRLWIRLCPRFQGHAKASVWVHRNESLATQEVELDRVQGSPTESWKLAMQVILDPILGARLSQ